MAAASGATPPPGDIELDYVGSVSNAATVIASLHRGEKRLVFCDSRQLVEEIGAALRERGVTTFLSHASLPLDERHRAELLPTLGEFLACSGSWNACASAMYVHVNTVRYRIGRIEELTGRDLSALTNTSVEVISSPALEAGRDADGTEMWRLYVGVTLTSTGRVGELICLEDRTQAQE